MSLGTGDEYTLINVIPEESTKLLTELRWNDIGIPLVLHHQIAAPIRWPVIAKRMGITWSTPHNAALLLLLLHVHVTVLPPGTRLVVLLRTIIQHYSIWK